MLKTIAGAIIGYIFSAATSIALFRLSHHDPHAPQPAWFIAVAVIYGIVFSALAGYIAARIGGYQSGFAVGVMTFVVALLSAMLDARGAHWSQVVALVAMSPASVLGAKLASVQR